ncbi:hypothetical protein FMM05_01105 [Flavobacterium zepuense]|uniref:Uncharacterized protein n=1 Tax=Flavobacterium zepuense TaxID=2593302 RepID=A0A552V9W2_9FLAO|nr:hypothetical protein [Flavobacterium zepuense]TRW27266.1 hypothetical protein FMM05_01105 [Flavobacterium zepuense]
MKTKKIYLTILALTGYLTISAQNVSQTATLTSGGQDAGTVGTGNVFYGYRAGKSLTGFQPGNSTFIGHSAGSNSGNGMSNLAVGYQTGFNLGNGSENVFLGAQAGFKSSGNSKNVLVGADAGYNVTADANTIIGYKAGYLNTSGGNVFIGNTAGYNETTGNKLYIENSTANTPLIYGDFAANKLVFNGKVGITNETLANQANLFPASANGVNVSNYQLFVKGGILTEEIRVTPKNATNWADYVFNDNYNLLTLEEVECYIEQNGHLPNIPSAKEIDLQGFEVAEMAKLQQEKIEELTLYVIDQNKTINNQQEQINELKKMVEQLVEDNKK